MFFCQLYNEVAFKSKQTIMSDKCIQKEFIYNVLCFSASWCLAFSREPYRRKQVQTLLIIETSSYLLVTILVLYFNDYDIHVNTLFKALKDGFTVKVKNVYIQVQNAVDVKRIVTRLAFFQLSEGRSRSSNGSHKQLTTVEAG